MHQSASGVIEADLPCAKCGYSLRTLCIDGVCPECGWAVARSIAEPDDRQVLLIDERVLAAYPKHLHWRKLMVRIMWLCAALHLAFIVFLSLLATTPFGPAAEYIVIGALAGTQFLLVFALLLWWGFRARCQYAEFVMSARADALNERSAADKRRDDAVCRRENIYRRNIGAAKALFWLQVIALALYLSLALGPALTRLPFALPLLSPLLWLVLIPLIVWINSGRRAQARSIRYHGRLSRQPEHAQASC